MATGYHTGRLSTSIISKTLVILVVFTIFTLGVFYFIGNQDITVLLDGTGLGDTAAGSVDTRISGIDSYTKLQEGQAGDNTGILLRGAKKEEVHRGQVLAKPKSVNPHTEFTAEVYILKKEEGGRHTPFFSGYKPQFYIRTTDGKLVPWVASQTDILSDDWVIYGA